MRQIRVSSGLLLAMLGLVGGMAQAQFMRSPSGDMAGQGSAHHRGVQGAHHRRDASGNGGTFNDTTSAAWPSNAPAAGATGIGGVSGQVGAPGDGRVGAPGDGRVGAPGDGRVGAPGNGQVGAPGAGATTDR